MSSNYLSWITFSRYLVNNNEHLRVLTYVNTQLVQLCFLLRKGIVNYRDINIISFFNNGIICFIINIDSDEQQSAF